MRKRKSVAPNFLLFYVFEIVNNSWSEHQPRLILATTNQETKICNVLMGKTFVPCHLNQKCAKNNNQIQRKAVWFFCHQMLSMIPTKIKNLTKESWVYGCFKLCQEVKINVNIFDFATLFEQSMKTS